MEIDFFWALLAGLLAAYLINYLSDVLPQTRRLSAPRCLSCGQALPWSGYLRLASCPHCGAAPSRRHNMVLMLIPLLTLWEWTHLSADIMPAPAAAGWGRFISWLLIVFFGLVFVIDVEHRVVLNEVSLVGAVLMAALGIWLHNWQTTLLGGLGGWASMYALYGLGELYIRWKNRRGPQFDENDVALGFGDVKLAGILGLLLGWPDVLIMLLLALLLGGLVGIFIILWLLVKKQPIAKASMPYAPYLALVTAYILLL